MRLKKLSNIFTIKNFAKHKRRFDRGGTYQGYIAIFFSGGTLLVVLGANKWWMYILGAIGIITFRYVAGWIDDYIGILATEQSQYSMKNETIMDIHAKLDKLLNG